MLGFIFGSLIRKLQRAAQNLSRYFVASAGEEMGKLFDERLYPFANQFDYMLQRRLAQAGQVSTRAVQDISELKDAVKDDIDTWLESGDETYKDNLNLTFEAINQARAEAIRDLRATLGEIDSSLEHQIDRISLTVMETVKQVREISVRFTPEAFRTELLQPAFNKLEALEDKLFLDAEGIIDQLDEVVAKTNEELKNNFLKRLLAHALPNPFDNCRRLLNISGKIGPSLSDIELYELTECHELSQLSEHTSVEEVLKTYEELQLNAAKMAALAKEVPSRKKRAIQDWLKYGALCQFWRNTLKTYDCTAPLALDPQKAQELLTDQAVESNP
ncbi:hypothetical protein [Kamptonema formosum]|uniref:hypothetical protein n=1 Tax=Kamptonema formosum TaxID=331992 RepID=UPI000349744F|nr:hypothetical protein [Oscillatoria sp. PCC 10802]